MSSGRIGKILNLGKSKEKAPSLDLNYIPSFMVAGENSRKALLKSILFMDILYSGSGFSFEKRKEFMMLLTKEGDTKEEKKAIDSNIEAAITNLRNLYIEAKGSVHKDNALDFIKAIQTLAEKEMKHIKFSDKEIKNMDFTKIDSESKKLHSKLEAATELDIISNPLKNYFEGSKKQRQLQILSVNISKMIEEAKVEVAKALSPYFGGLVYNQVWKPLIEANEQRERFEMNASQNDEIIDFYSFKEACSQEEQYPQNEESLEALWNKEIRYFDTKYDFQYKKNFDDSEIGNVSQQYVSLRLADKYGNHKKEQIFSAFRNNYKDMDVANKLSKLTELQKRFEKLSKICATAEKSKSEEMLRSVLSDVDIANNELKQILKTTPHVNVTKKI